MVSIVVVNWNGGRLLEECLGSPRCQLLPPDRLVVVDNGPSDGSADLVKRRYPDVQPVELWNNTGFSRGNNLGIQRAQGDCIALLNIDAEPHPAWLEQLVAALEANPEVGFCASKMLLYDEPSLADASIRSRVVLQAIQLSERAGVYPSPTR